MRAWGLAATIVYLGCGVPPASPVDSHAPASDGQAIDTSNHDAAILPTDVPAVPCTATPAEVYATLAQPTAALGAILACAPDPVLEAADVSGLVGANIDVSSAVAQFRVAYETRDGSGNPAVSTARVYLPATPRSRPVPIVVAIHGSVGLADACVPSVNSDDSLPLPYAARGFAVIAPDLAGLGNAGTQDYLDNRAQGWQALDGARALRALLPTGLTAAELILTGYSQGGGTALSAQSLIHADGAGIGTLVATVAYAPEWPISMKSFDYDTMLRVPTTLTIAEGLSYSSVAVLRQYAFLEDHVAPGRGKDAVPAQYRTALEAAVQSQCVLGLGGYIQTSMFHTGDLIDPALRTSLLACLDGQPGCAGDGAAYAQFLADNVLAPDASAGPVLIVQGLLDQIMPPAKEGSCVRDKLVGAGVAVDTCVVSDATHTNIMDHHWKGLAWAESVLGGGAHTECASVTQLPACTN